jgi:hypothetical protein
VEQFSKLVIGLTAVNYSVAFAHFVYCPPRNCYAVLYVSNLSLNFLSAYLFKTFENISTAGI